jgi:hypothetical protein
LILPAAIGITDTGMLNQTSSILENLNLAQFIAEKVVAGIPVELSNRGISYFITIF